eukprot:GILJ01010104.1.p1 GENE.GILJ01010104.1~~GILJ01010104.1.p1  ORF type:complete len:262 (+),score=4.86 GILJ01010104.1:310-1095(+)
MVYVATLPAVAIVEVFHFLTAPQRHCARQVDKEWCEIGSHERLWFPKTMDQSVLLAQSPLVFSSNDVLTSMRKLISASFVRLDVFDCSGFGTFVNDLVVRSLPATLRSLHLVCASVTDLGLLSLPVRLKILTLISCGRVTASGLRALISACQHTMQYLTVASCPQLTGSDLSKVIPLCSGLVSFRSNQATDELIEALVCLPSLTDVDLSGSQGVSLRALRKLVEMPSLRSLRLSDIGVDRYTLESLLTSFKCRTSSQLEAS